MDAPAKHTTPSPGCPSAADLARAASQASDDDVLAHVRGCPTCEASWRQQRALLAIAARLPFVPPAPQRQRQVREQLLATVAGTPRPRRPAALVIGAALAGVVTVAALVLVQSRGFHRDPAGDQAAATASRAVIAAAPGARFVRISGPPHEVIRLYEGLVRFTVAPAGSAEQTFAVVTGQGRVEVRGTIFETTARGDELVAVKVEHGRVAVRPTIAETASAEVEPELMLEAGHAWQKPAPLPETPVSRSERLPLRDPALPPTSPRPGSSRARAPARPSDPATVAFGHGMALLRASNLPAAAVAFEQAATLSPSGTLAEDASYWHAVTLNKAGAPDAGREALESFLTRFPRSARAGETSVRLGWLLLDRGLPADASSRFRAGLADRSSIVRKSAQAGLDALAARKSAPPP
jgi:hypothetical protein